MTCVNGTFPDFGPHDCFRKSSILGELAQAFWAISLLPNISERLHVSRVGPFRNEGQEGSTRNTLGVSLGGASWRFACWVARATRCDWAWWLVVWRSMMIRFFVSRKGDEEFIVWSCLGPNLFRSRCFEPWCFKGSIVRGVTWRCLTGRRHKSIARKKSSCQWASKTNYFHQMEISRGCQAAIKKEGEDRELTGRLPEPPGWWKIVNSLDLSPRCWLLNCPWRFRLNHFPRFKVFPIETTSICRYKDDSRSLLANKCTRMSQVFLNTAQLHSSIYLFLHVLM